MGWRHTRPHLIRSLTAIWLMYTPVLNQVDPKQDKQDSCGEYGKHVDSLKPAQRPITRLFYSLAVVMNAWTYMYAHEILANYFTHPYENLCVGCCFVAQVDIRQVSRLHGGIVHMKLYNNARPRPDSPSKIEECDVSIRGES